MNSTPKNKQGFPITRCTRCAGSGQYGPSSVHNGTCFACGGSGWTIKGKRAADAWTAYQAAQRAHWHPVAGDLQIGDRVRIHKRDELRTITGIRWEYQGKSDGGSQSGSIGSPNFVASSHLFTHVVVEFEDGSEERLWGTNLVIASRAGRIDPAPYLEAAGVK